MKPRSKRILKRILITLFTVLIVLFVAAWAFSTFYLESWLTNRLSQSVTEATNGRYALTMDKLHVDLIGQNFRIDGLHLRRDTSVQKTSGVGMLDKNDADLQLDLAVHGWNFFKLLGGRELAVGRIEVSSPTLTMQQLRNSSASDTTDPLLDTQRKLQSLSSNTIRDIVEFRQLNISNADFHFFTPGDTTPNFQFAGLTTTIDEFKPDLPVLESLENLEFRFNKLALVTDANNWLELGPTELVDEEITLANLILKPLYAKQDAAETKGFQASWVGMELQGIRLSEANPIKWIRDTTCYIKKAEVDSLLVDSYRDRSIPTESTERQKPPVELLEQLPFYVHVDSLVVHYGQVTIEEEQIGIEKLARITLDNLSAMATNVFTDFDTIHPIKVSGSFSINRQIPISITSQLITNMPNYPFAVSAWSSGGDMQIFNPFIAPSTGLELKSGTCQQLTMNMHATDTYAEGTIDFEYKDLKIQRAYDKTGPSLKTLIGNVVLRNNNLKGERNYVQAEVSAQRNENKQIFHFLILFLRSGLKQTVGLPTRKPSPRININIPNPLELFQRPDKKVNEQ